MLERLLFVSVDKDTTNTVVDKLNQALAGERVWPRSVSTDQDGMALYADIPNAMNDSDKLAFRTFVYGFVVACVQEPIRLSGATGPTTDQIHADSLADREQEPAKRRGRKPCQTVALTPEQRDTLAYSPKITSPITLESDREQERPFVEGNGWDNIATSIED